MPFQPVAVPLSLQFTPVKAIRDVAAMRAIFPGAVLIDAKYTPAMAAYDLSITAMLYQFRVSVPPLRPARIRTKQPGFPSRSLNQRDAAALTRFFRATGLVFNYTTQSIPLAVGFYGIHGQSHYLRNLLVAESLLAIGCQHSFFIGRHMMASF